MRDEGEGVVTVCARARARPSFFLSLALSLCSHPPPPPHTHTISPHSLSQTLRINPAKTDIDAFTFDDFELVGYEPAKKIAMQMAV